MVAVEWRSLIGGLSSSTIPSTVLATIATLMLKVFLVVEI